MAFSVSATFTSASANIANYSEIPYSFGPGNISTGTSDQVLAFGAYGDSATGTATIEVVIVQKDTNEVIWYERAAVAASSTRRTGSANTSGSYLCSVVFTTSARNTVDTIMCPAGSVSAGNYKVMVGCPALTTFTSLTVYAVGSGIP